MIFGASIQLAKTKNSAFPIRSSKHGLVGLMAEKASDLDAVLCCHSTACCVPQSVALQRGHRFAGTSDACMSQCEPYWGRECRFLTALFNDDVSVASSLLEGFDGPQVDPDIRIRIGGDFKPAVCIAVERDHLRLSQFDLDPWFSL
ncbi:serine/threonine-protein phosphatase 6 regulatory ankyrin repeat subunit B isoform X1 [Ixodes scapularis]